MHINFKNNIIYFYIFELIIQSKHQIQPHIGKQPIARWYFPPEVDYRLSLLPPDAKGLVVWIIEAKVLGFFFAEYEVLLSDHEKCDSSFCVFFRCLGSVQGRTAVSCLTSIAEASSQGDCRMR